MFSSYKHRIICYLLSHTNALSCEEVQNALLKSTATILNKAKVQILLPTLRTVAEKASSAAPANIFTSTSEDLTTRLLSCFDSAATPYLNDTPTAWAIFLQPFVPIFAQVRFLLNLFPTLRTFNRFRYTTTSTKGSRLLYRKWFIRIIEATAQNRAMRSIVGRWFPRSVCSKPYLCSLVSVVVADKLPDAAVTGKISIIKCPH